MNNIVIFGAQGYALGTFKAIKTVYPDKNILCFLVSKVGGLNPDTLGGLPVRELDEFSGSLSDIEKNQTEIIIATPENIQPEIEELLDSYGLTNHSRLTAAKWEELMMLYHAKLGRFIPLRTLSGEDLYGRVMSDREKLNKYISEVNGHVSNIDIKSFESHLHIFMAKFYKDKVLKEKVELPDYMVPIQVGTELTDVRVADICDNQGNNISKKNVNYCETTALYWMWRNVIDVDDEINEYGIGGADYKNAVNLDVQYYGLAQYRRMFRFSDEDLLRLFFNDVDVVLPYPMPYELDINAHHNRYLKDVDWNAMLTALRELSPEYAKAFEDILKQQFMYNYNVILAKKEVLRDYCAWLFPILERTEELSVPKGSERADRYIGYMAETLETLYFMYNRDKFKIVHTGCKLFS
ncbi:MAG: DUF4422 domain-containing protein [Lachnospiraceae bacterium]|nr:DUF4422 domain-containing protein [Lachnospiraceae bacterium]